MFIHFGRYLLWNLYLIGITVHLNYGLRMGQVDSLKGCFTEAFFHGRTKLSGTNITLDILNLPFRECSYLDLNIECIDEEKQTKFVQYCFQKLLKQIMAFLILPDKFMNKSCKIIYFSEHYVNITPHEDENTLVRYRIWTWFNTLGSTVCLLLSI